MISGKCGMSCFYTSYTETHNLIPVRFNPCGKTFCSAFYGHDILNITKF